VHRFKYLHFLVWTVLVFAVVIACVAFVSRYRRIVVLGDEWSQMQLQDVWRYTLCIRRGWLELERSKSQPWIPADDAVSEERNLLLFAYWRSRSVTRYGPFWIPDLLEWYEKEGWAINLWAIAIVLLPWPVWQVKQATKRRAWIRKGACPECGYDLRAAVAGRCPECGECVRHSRYGE
jgi:hypothetical protein